jgi:hypothetical protein
VAASAAGAGWRAHHGTLALWMARMGADLAPILDSTMSSYAPEKTTRLSLRNRPPFSEIDGLRGQHRDDPPTYMDIVACKAMAS